MRSSQDAAAAGGWSYAANVTWSTLWAVFNTFGPKVSMRVLGIPMADEPRAWSL